MQKPMFTKEGHYWVFFINNPVNGQWVEADNRISAKYIFALREGVVVSSYIVATKKGFKP